MASNTQQRDAIDSIVQYLDRINLRESARTLERESGLFFNLAYFEDRFIRGAFEAAEGYITGFTGVHDNIFSINVVFELRWHKFLAALSENQREEARVIIGEELSPLGRYNENLVGFATHLVNLHNFRMHEAFSHYGDPEYHRRERVEFIRSNLEANPLLLGKIRNVRNVMLAPPQFSTAPVASLVPIPAPIGPPRRIALPGVRDKGISLLLRASFLGGSNQIYIPP